MKKPKPCCLPHSPDDFITDVEQFSITITFKIMSFSVFQWPDQTRQFSSRSFLAHCFVARAFYFGPVKGISLPLLSF